MQLLLNNSRTFTCFAAAELGTERFAFKQVFSSVVVLIGLFQSYNVGPITQQTQTNTTSPTDARITYYHCITLISENRITPSDGSHRIVWVIAVGKQTAFL